MHKGKGAGRSTWQTPQWVLDIVRGTIGGAIGLDPATTSDNPTGALKFYTPEDDGLAHAWQSDSIFLNPPWSRKEGVDLRPWLEQAQRARVSSPRPVETFVCISAAMNAQWFHRWLGDADAYFFPRGRIAYNSPDPEADAQAPGFDSVLCYWGAHPLRFKVQCGGRGLVLG